MGDGSHDTRDQRASVAQATQMLGISEGAVRKRVERGKMRAERDDAGRLIVYLDSDTTATDTTRDRPRPSRDQGESDRYTRSLEDQVEHLRRQLEEAHAANRENRRIIAGLTQRIPELMPAPQEPPSGKRDAPETVTPEPERAEPRSATAGSQEDTEPPQDRTRRLQQELLETRQMLEDARSRPRSWWRRMFGN
ncbi:MAG: hypothetical protein M3N18_06035 [Actinomycetota bacterium]|nr:hypothetical protein [Actinomycetota bacterium]